MKVAIPICVLSATVLLLGEPVSSPITNSASTPQPDRAEIQVTKLFSRSISGLPKNDPLATSLATINSAEFSPDGKKLAVLAKNFALVWDSQSGKELHRFSFQFFPSFANFSLDNRSLYVESFSVDEQRRRRNRISKWDLKSGDQLFSVPGTRGTIRCLPGAKEFYGQFAGVITVRDSQNGALLRTLKGENEVWARLHDSTIGQEALPTGKLRLWDLRTFKPVTTYDLPQGSNSLTPAQKMFWSKDWKAKTLTFWTLPKGEMIRSLELDHRPIRIAFGPGDRVVAIGSSIEVPPAPTPKPPFRLERPPLFDPAKVVRKKYDGCVSLYDIASGQKLATLDRPPGRPLALTFSPDGTLLAASSEHILQVFRITWSEKEGKK